MTFPQVEEQDPMTSESELFCFDLTSLRVCVVIIVMMVSTLYYTLAFQTFVI